MALSGDKLAELGLQPEQYDDQGHQINIQPGLEIQPGTIPGSAESRDAAGLLVAMARSSHQDTEDQAPQELHTDQNQAGSIQLGAQDQHHLHAQDLAVGAFQGDPGQQAQTMLDEEHSTASTSIPPILDAIARQPLADPTQPYQDSHSQDTDQQRKARRAQAQRLRRAAQSAEQRAAVAAADAARHAAARAAQSAELNAAAAAASAAQEATDRANQIIEQRKAALAAHAERQRQRRASQTADQRAAALASNAARQRERRAARTPEQRAEAAAAHAARQRKRRAAQTAEQRAQAAAADAARQRIRRAAQTAEQRQATLAADAARHAAARASQSPMIEQPVAVPLPEVPILDPSGPLTLDLGASVVQSPP
ncbi:hypothetical protein ABBQ32_010737 [Trebouxia sp. C0010 RCD-2024]